MMRYLTLITMVAVALLAGGSAQAEDTTFDREGGELKDSQGQSIGDDSDPISRWLSMGPINPDKLFVPIGEIWDELFDMLEDRPEEEDEEEDEPQRIGVQAEEGSSGGRNVK